MDTALLLCGILTCREHFQHSEISDLATEMFNRVDWNWLSEDTRILPHGWTPETGFLQYRWDSYSEMMMMYLMGMGSSTTLCPRIAGMRGSERLSNSTGYDSSARTRRYSSTNIPRRGLIFAASAIATPTTFKIR